MIKIGVCRTHVKTSEAFSDTMDGWAIYDGQLRHNSNSSGKKYGTKLKEGDVIGVMLDMIKVSSTTHPILISIGRTKLFKK